MRMRKRLGIVLAALGLAAAGPALALPVGTFQVTAQMDGGTPFSLPVSVDVDGNGEVSVFSMQSTDLNPLDPLEWEITVTAFLDPDPSIIYGLAVTDFGAPTTFGFSFTQGIVPTPAPGVVRAENASSTTNGSGAGVPVTPAAPPAGIPVDSDGDAEIFVHTLSTDGGTTFLSADIDLREAFTGGAGSDTQAALSEGFIPGPAGSGLYDTMRVDANFSMAGGNDVYTFNGEFEVVPEPGTATLLALGLGGFALVRSRRRI